MDKRCFVWIYVNNNYDFIKLPEGQMLIAKAGYRYGFNNTQ